MIFRTLGRTGMDVSVVGVGTWQFGGEWGRNYTQAEADEIFDAARECDINLVDTAECYGDHLSERLVGKAIARDRGRWVVATKFGHHFHEPFKRDNLIDPASVRRQLEDSLRALGVEVIDLYQFHSLDDAAFATNGLWEMLVEEKRKGKIRHLGVSIGSNENAWQTAQAFESGAEVIQVVYNRLDRKPEAEVFPICEMDHLGVLARVPLASGYLSGKYQVGDRFPVTDVRGKWHSADKTDEALREVDRIRREEVPAGVDMAAWALAWCLRHPAVTAVIPGCKDAGQVRRNAAAVELLTSS